MLQIIAKAPISKGQGFFFQAWNGFQLEAEQDWACWERFARYFNPITGTSHHNIEAQMYFVLSTTGVSARRLPTHSEQGLSGVPGDIITKVASMGNTSRCGTLSKHLPPL